MSFAWAWSLAEGPGQGRWRCRTNPVSRVMERNFALSLCLTCSLSSLSLSFSLATSAQRRTLKRRCTHRPSVIYLIVNKLLSLARAHSFFNLSLVLAAYLAFLCVRARTHARARIHKTIQPAGPRRIFAVVRILLEACPNGN